MFVMERIIRAHTSSALSNTHMLTHPLVQTTTLHQVLELEHFGPLLQFLPWRNRRAVAVTLVRSILDSRATLGEMGSVQKLFGMLVPMIREEPVVVSGEVQGGTGDKEEEGPGAAAVPKEEGEGMGEKGAATLEEEQVRMGEWMRGWSCIMDSSEFAWSLQPLPSTPFSHVPTTHPQTN